MPARTPSARSREVVRILEADPATDWSKVDIERLRQHLIDMSEVVLRSAVNQMPVPGASRWRSRGTGRTEQAIRAMVVPTLPTRPDACVAATDRDHPGRCAADRHRQATG